MAHRLDVLMRSKGVTNDDLAKSVGCTTNYVSGIRNGQKPGLKLATAICHEFPGEITLSDLGIEIDADIASPPDDAKAVG